MQFYSLAALAGLAGLTAATPAAQQDGYQYGWWVQDWEAGCVRGGCYYSFNISGQGDYTKDHNIPPFNAHCSDQNSGYPEDGGEYVDCEFTDDLGTNRALKSRILGSPSGSGANLEVSYQFSVDEPNGAYYNYTGNYTTIYNAAVAPQQVFKIVPTTIFGVA